MLLASSREAANSLTSVVLQSGTGVHDILFYDTFEAQLSAMHAAHKSKVELSLKRAV